jgi:hypothetical protein
MRMYGDDDVGLMRMLSVAGRVMKMYGEGDVGLMRMLPVAADGSVIQNRVQSPAREKPTGLLSIADPKVLKTQRDVQSQRSASQNGVSAKSHQFRVQTP